MLLPGVCDTGGQDAEVERRSSKIGFHWRTASTKSFAGIRDTKRMLAGGDEVKGGR